MSSVIQFSVVSHMLVANMIFIACSLKLVQIICIDNSLHLFYKIRLKGLIVDFVMDIWLPCFLLVANF